MTKLLTEVLGETRARKYVSALVLTGKEGDQSREGSDFGDFLHKSAPRKHAQQGELMIDEGVKDFQLQPVPNNY